jgi:diguanylate cyclase (GGDEF)-like protein
VSIALPTNPVTVLVDAIQQLSLARRTTDVQEIVRTAARNLTRADGATFVLRDGDKCFYADEDAIAPLWKGQRFPLEACISGWTMVNRTATTIPDIYADPRVPHDAYRPTFVKSLAMVPIRSIDPIGAIGNYWADPHEPTTEEVSALQSLADATAVALENVALSKQATVDKLTGALNRNGFFQQAERALEAARAAGIETVVAFADLDGLKEINDAQGHDAGDDAIRAAAEALGNVLGPHAVVGRIGGDEFAALVRAGDLPCSAERIPGALEGTVSIGVVSAPADGVESLDDLLAEADAKMYRLKGRPRSRRRVRRQA